MKHVRIAIALIAFIGLGYAASAAPGNTRSITDAAGNVVSLPEKPGRIAFFWANQFEIMMMAGVQDSIVAIHPNVKLFPWLVKYYPRVMRIGTPFGSPNTNMEELVSTAPDVVFLLESNKPLLDQAKSAGLPVVVLKRPYAIDSIVENIKVIESALGGEATGKLDSYLAYLAEKRAVIARRVEEMPVGKRPTVACVLVDKTLRVPGTGTIMDEWIPLAGGRNVATEFSGYKEVDVEQFLAWNPDYIIVPSMLVRDKFLKGAEFQTLTAVKTGHVVVNPHGFFDWQYTAPEVALQIQWAAKVLHPAEFADFDLAKEVKAYHEKFFGVTLSSGEIEEILCPKTYDATP
jgi:iron complex transport system substrate-binding protein